MVRRVHYLPDVTGKMGAPIVKVTYTPAGESYFAQRRLRRHARVWHLWAMGIGAVISGDFFGWNYGMAEGGFGGMLIALLAMTAMYIGLCFSIAEMAPALPHAGGAYSFARTAMGPWGGYITGLAENMEYILTPAVIVVGVGQYLGSIFGTPASWEPACGGFRPQRDSGPDLLPSRLKAGARVCSFVHWSRL